ncbi:hypothetical protein R84981_001128 [Carnimonas sp. R-84981]
MTGMSRFTGKALTENAHIAQSIGDILTTPIGTRLIRRYYGSLLPELIDQPMNDETRLKLMSATVDAITRWEPRVRIQAVDSLSTAAGRLTLKITAARVRDAQSIELEVRT